MRTFSFGLGAAMLGFIGLVSLLTPFQNTAYFDRWFQEGILWSLVTPPLLLLCAFALFWGLRTGRDAIPFLATQGLFVVSFVGLGISFYPYILPPSLTIQEAAAPDSSLLFALVGASILIPIILIYTAYSYYVFRGKMDPEEGYH